MTRYPSHKPQNTNKKNQQWIEVVPLEVRRGKHWGV